MKNSIFIIHPYLDRGSWVFDDDSVGLIREPFVMNADTFLSLAGKGKTELTAIFSDSKFPGAEYEIKKIESYDSFSGTWYHSEHFNMDLWLCPALNLYYPESPNQLFIQIK